MSKKLILVANSSGKEFHNKLFLNINNLIRVLSITIDFVFNREKRLILDNFGVGTTQSTAKSKKTNSSSIRTTLIQKFAKLWMVYTGVGRPSKGPGRPGSQSIWQNNK